MDQELLNRWAFCALLTLCSLIIISLLVSVLRLEHSPQLRGLYQSYPKPFILVGIGHSITFIILSVWFCVNGCMDSVLVCAIHVGQVQVSRRVRIETFTLLTGLELYFGSCMGPCGLGYLDVLAYHCLYSGPSVQRVSSGWHY